MMSDPIVDIRKEMGNLWVGFSRGYHVIED